jgi:hypothetical protein
MQPDNVHKGAINCPDSVIITTIPLLKMNFKKNYSYEDLCLNMHTPFSRGINNKETLKRFGASREKNKM